MSEEKRKKDKTGILFSLTVLTIVGIILLTLITAFASTEAGPTDATPVLNNEQMIKVIESLTKTKSKTGSVEATTTACEITLIKVGMPEITRTLIYHGVDFGKYTVENFHEACAKNVSIDCADCGSDMMNLKWKDIQKLTVKCPLADGDFTVTIKKN